VLGETGPGPRLVGPPTDAPAPRLPDTQVVAGESPRRRGAFLAFVAFLAGALVVGAAFGTYALGDRRAGDERSVTTTVTRGSLDVRGILDKAQPSVVSIRTGSENSIFGGAGSGIVLSSDGKILTNAHVIASSGGKIEVRFNDGRTASASIIGASTKDDLALLQVDATGLQAAKLGSSANLRVGDDVVAIGNALALGDDPSVTKGIVSAKNRSISEGEISLTHLIQTDAAINPGNSGGPLVNAAGEVVGINTAIIEGAQSVGFSISIDQVKTLLPKLEAGEGDIDPDGAVLGVSTITVDAQLSDALRTQYGVTAKAGALISQMDGDSAAADSGLQVGDVIVEFDGSAVANNEQVTSAVKAHKKGDKVSITVERKGNRRTFEVTLGPR
jgi:putative serine protease PepD